MRTGYARTASVPPTLPLTDAPLVSVPLATPPVIEWISVNTHGTYAREDYRLPELWCLHLYRWTGALGAGGVMLPVAPGFCSVVPPGTPLSHFFRTGGTPSVHISCGFRLPRAGSNTLLPLMGDTGHRFGAFNTLLEKAVGVWAFSPHRAESLVWDLLWQLVEGGTGARSLESDESGSASVEPSVVTRARETIELRLGEPLRVETLARDAGLSHNHFTRLFHAATGKTVVAYLRERRIERATRLLLHTTIPLKQVAAQVGLADAHQFNKAVRAATGVSPSALRKRLTPNESG